MSARGRAEQGFSVLEMVVAVSIFALLIVMIDSLFFTAYRHARGVELAADVQQNARIALDRLTRELREASPSQIAVGGPPGSMAVVFKAARPAFDPAVFCAYVRTRTDSLYRSGCYSWTGAPLPPYTTDPPYAPPCNTPTGAPCGTYAPIWQRTVGYYVAASTVTGLKELRRVVRDLASPDAPLPDPATLRGGEAVATYIEAFDATVSAGSVAVVLTLGATEIVRGTALRPERIILPGTVLLRN